MPDQGIWAARGHGEPLKVSEEVRNRISPRWGVVSKSGLIRNG